ncbi:peroxisomal sarcosine oxidase-like [Macrobrachium nipponense]|uniref:peroxisomal sarcosine oxidase-like n=1 Tax=Macrobrachium nipponense TaxID=159736 RepID=UPI0030C7FFDD
MDYEVAVIGAGVMGSSAAYYLAKAGRRTILIDQFPLPHTRGSSGGHSRITRQANYGSPALTSIMFDSNKEWHRIAEQAGIDLFRPYPLVCVGPGDSTSAADKLHKMEESIRNSGFEPQILAIEEVNDKYRTSFPSNYKAVVDPSAGVLLADKCIQAFRKLYVNSGGTVLDNWPVTSVIPGDIIEIKGTRGKDIKVKNVVICPGPWLGPFLETLGLKIPVWAEKIGVFYWKIVDAKMPGFTFIDTSDADHHFYALPDVEYPGYMKLCPHVGPMINPNERDKADISGLLRQGREYVANYFPCLESNPSVMESCMYTLTPDEAFILDRHPKHKNIIFAGGFSGSGFKIAPSCGEALARMAMGLDHKLDFSSFNCSRFTQQHVRSRL